MAGLSSGGGGGPSYVQDAQPVDPDLGETWLDTDGGSDGNGEMKVWTGSEWQTTGYISHSDLNNVSPAQHHDPVTVSAPLTRSAQAVALAYADGLALDANDDLAVDLGDGLTMDSNGRVKASLGNALSINGGTIAVQDGQIDHDATSGGTDADAHHDPVTVSAPITRSGQTLALAIANGLALDGNNDLTVDESDLSLANLGDYPVNESDLGFETATQSDLDSHESDTSNPHNVTDDQTGAASALSSHESDTDAHHAIPASVLDDGSDISVYDSDAGNGSSVLCDLTGSGYLLGGVVEDGTDGSLTATISADGGSFVLNPTKVNISEGGNHDRIMIPQIRFSNSLKVEFSSAYNSCSGQIIVKQ